MQTVRQEGGRPGRRLVRRTGAIVPGGRRETNGIGRIAAVALVVPGPVEIDRRLILIAVTDRTIDHRRPIPILNAELLVSYERELFCGCRDAGEPSAEEVRARGGEIEQLGDVDPSRTLLRICPEQL